MKRGTRILLLIIAGALAVIVALLPYAKPQAPQTLEEVLTPTEQAILSNLTGPSSRLVLRIGNIPDTPPIDMPDDAGERDGFTWGIIQLLEEKLGIRTEWVPCGDDWEARLRDHTVDLVGSIQQTPERAQEFDFSDSYWPVQMIIVAHKTNGPPRLSLDGMNGYKVAVVDKSAIQQYLVNLKETAPDRYGYRLFSVDSTTNGMDAVSEGTVDALVADDAAYTYYWSSHGRNLVKVGDTDYTWNLRFACNTNSPLPVSILNKALGLITDVEKNNIAGQYPMLQNNPPRDIDNVLLLEIIGAGLIVTLFSVGAVTLLRNRTLRRQITTHMHELGRVRQSHAQATRALGESEERFRVLVESSNDIIWEMDRYGSYTYVSPRIESVLGYPPEELIGKSSVSLMIPSHAARKMEQLRRKTVDTIIDCEINIYRHKEGHKVILESSGMAYNDNTGELAGFRGVSRDITERIANENALRTSEERFRNLVETTSDWIWEIDTNGIYTYLSPQSSELLGYDPAAMLGTHFTALMPDVEAVRLKMHFKTLSETGKPIQSLVNTYQHRDGRTVMLETSAVPFYDDEWNIHGYRGISRDITERVATEKKLEFERNLFHSFMEHAPDLIYFKDEQGRFIEVNAAKADELRRPIESILGKTDFDFLPREQAQQKFDDEVGVMKNLQPLQKEEMATTPDGDRWYLTTKVPRYDEDGRVVGTFGTSWDITYRKQAEEELRQLRALLSNTIDSMPSILVGVDAESRIIQWNRQAESASGIAASEALGMYLRNAFPELAKEMIKVERAIREQRPQIEERVRVKKDMHTRYRDITVFPLSGDTEGAVIRVDDVTDRVMLEDSIRNIVEGVASVGRRFFGSMVAQLGKTLDADFTFISEFVDESQVEMRTIAVAMHGEVVDNFDYVLAETPFAKVIEDNRCTHISDVRKQFPGQELLEANKIESYIGIPLVNSENRTLGIMVAMYREPVEQVDFASSIMQVFAGRTTAELERMQATKELINLRNLLENIINSMPSILIGVDAEGRVMQWNHEAERISGMASSRAYGQSIERVFPDLGTDMKSLFQNLLQKGPQQHERIPCLIRGDQRIVDITVYPIVNEGSDGAVIRLDDVTDRVRIEDMMVQSEKMMSVGGLAAGMAHEINNPLAGIMQNMQVIRNRIMHDTKRNNEAAAEAGTTLQAVQAYMEARGLLKMLDTAAEAGHRAAKIVDNMLSFSRKDESHFAPNNLEEIIERSIDLASNDYNLKKRFDFRHIRIIRELDALEAIPCEASQIQQVLLNLLSNSAQAMAKKEYRDEEPQICIRLKREADMALIEVEDNGPGMNAETRKRAFEPFFTTKEVGHGTGLGLSVSFFIITENHGGTMHLDSAPGRGACFSIRIPFEHRMAQWGLRL